MTAEGMQRSGAGTVARRRPMSLWRLERLRLLRSRRLVVLLGVFTFFGLTGPMLARYMGELLERFGGGVTVTVPEPVPADGITQYLANSSQIGVLVVLVVAAGALAFDATPELAAFLRARTPVRRLLMPRYVLSVLAAGTAFTVGMLAAWYETQVLLGGLPVGAMLVGIGLSWLYLAFAVAVVAVASALTRSVLATVALSAGLLIALPIVGVVEPLRRWLPSHLVGAPDALLRGAAAADYTMAALATAAATVGLLLAAVRMLRRREL